MTACSSRFLERAETSERCAKLIFSMNFRKNFRDRRPIAGLVACAERKDMQQKYTRVDLQGEWANKQYWTKSLLKTIPRLLSEGWELNRGGRTPTYVHVRRRASTYVDVRRRTSTYVDVRRRVDVTSTYVHVRRRTSTYADVRRRTSTYAYGRRRQKFSSSEIYFEAPLRRTCVGRVPDVRRMSDGRPTGVQWTSNGRTSVGGPTDV